jgi:hypothetical protein
VIQIVMVEMPKILVDILDTYLRDQRAMRVIEHLPDASKALASQAVASADVVLFGLETHEFGGICDPLLRTNPRLTAFSVPRDGKTVYECRLEPKITDEGEATPSRIVELISKARLSGSQ